MQRNSIFLLLFVALTGLISACSDMGKPAEEELSILKANNHPMLMKYCNDCHAPPKPVEHKSSEWTNVIYRMNNHRIMNSLDAIPENDKKELLAYLISNASDS